MALKDKPLTYTILDKYIVVAAKGPDTVAVDTSRIYGYVTGPEGQALPGVTVRVRGSVLGATTDDKGQFSLQAPPDAVLSFSYIGYQEAEIALNGRQAVNVSLKPAITGLGQLVVVGYGTTEKKDLTSAITTVNTKLLDNRSLTNLSSSLEGITPGVYIQQQNGRPGMSGASSFDIRGASLSTFSSNPPLVIIDGVVDNIDDINPADVASISVLKDAAASAIYGARATGGVVLITTKRGSPGKVAVTYNGTYGLQRQPYGDLKFVNTATWMKANNEAAELDGSPDIFTQTQIAQYTHSKNSQFPESTQWTSWIAKTAPQQTHNISIKGGTDKINFFLAGGLLIQKGFIPHDGFTRKNVLLNLDYHPTNRLKIGVNVAYLRDDQSQPGIDYNGGVFGEVRNAIFTPPNEPLYNPNGTFNNNVIWGSNPVYNIINGGTMLSTDDNLRMSLAFDYEIIKGLSLNITTATKLFYTINNSLYPKIPYYDANGNILGYSRSNATVVENWGKSDYVNNQFLLKYKKNIGLHDFKIMGGVTYENEYDKGI
jgi:TonB-linked SusC/RagA family outer membrane protein